MKYFKSLFLLFMGCGFLLVTGCFPTSAYVARNQYLLDVKTFPMKPAADHRLTIAINTVSVMAPFNQLSFIYRINEFQYLTDYYHGFASPLSQQFDPLLLNYGRVFGNFTPVPVYHDLNSSTYRLQPIITYFYADYRDRQHPQAVVSLNLKLFKKPATLIMDKTFTARIPIQVKDTEHLLLAWDQGLRKVLTEGMKQVSSIDKKP